MKKEKLNTEQRVKEIIAEKLGQNPNKIIPQAFFVNDLGADSLDIVELIMAFEDEFDMEIPDEEAERLKTVKNAVDYIELKV